MRPYFCITPHFNCSFIIWRRFLSFTFSVTLFSIDINPLSNCFIPTANAYKKILLFVLVDRIEVVNFMMIILSVQTSWWVYNLWWGLYWRLLDGFFEHFKYFKEFPLICIVESQNSSIAIIPKSRRSNVQMRKIYSILPMNIIIFIGCKRHCPWITDILA